MALGFGKCDSNVLAAVYRWCKYQALYCEGSSELLRFTLEFKPHSLSRLSARPKGPRVA